MVGGSRGVGDVCVCVCVCSEGMSMVAHTLLCVHQIVMGIDTCSFHNYAYMLLYILFLRRRREETVSLHVGYREKIMTKLRPHRLVASSLAQ